MVREGASEPSRGLRGPITASTPERPWHLIVTDVDGDRHNELLVQGNGEVAVFQFDGRTLLPRWRVQTSRAILSLAASPGSSRVHLATVKENESFLETYSLGKDGVVTHDSTLRLGPWTSITNIGRPNREDLESFIYVKACDVDGELPCARRYDFTSEGWSAKGEFPAFYPIDGAVLADLDGDGIEDLLLCTSYFCGFFIADEAEGFTPGAAIEGMHINEVVNLDGDCALDFVGYRPFDRWGDAVQIVFNRAGDGVLDDLEPISTFDAGLVQVGDLDGDERIDILVDGVSGIEYSAGWVHWISWSPTGQPPEERWLHVSDWGGTIEIADVDGDGFDDLVALDSEARKVFVFLTAPLEELQAELEERCASAPLLRRGEEIALPLSNQSLQDAGCAARPIVAMPDAVVRLEPQPQGGRFSVVKEEGWENRQTVVSVIGRPELCAASGLGEETEETVLDFADGVSEEVCMLVEAPVDGPIRVRFD